MEDASSLYPGGITAISQSVERSDTTGNDASQRNPRSRRDRRRPTNSWEEERGQVSFFGRPLGRVVASRPSRTALLLVQSSSPKGKPRFTLRRSEFSSASVSTLFAHERQSRGNGGSSGIASQRRSLARWRRAYAELHCQSSASSMKFARTGFRSTYRMTVSKWPSV